MGDGSIFEAVFFQQRILVASDTLVPEAHAGAIDLEGRLGAAELQASVVDRRAHHALVDDIEAGVAEGGLDGVGTLPLLLDVGITEHEGVGWFVGLHCPMHDVDPVREEVGHCAATEGPVPTPAIELLCAEGLIGCAPEPLLPVQLRDVHRLWDPVQVVVLPPVSSRLRHSTQRAALNQIDGVAEVAPASLLHAALQNLLARPNRLLQDRAFFERVSYRLFEVDILPCCQGCGCNPDMPVVGRGDDDCVDALVVQHGAEVHVVGGSGGAGPLCDSLPPRRVDIADRYDLKGNARAFGGVEQLAHAPSSTDDPDAQAIVGSKGFGGSEGRKASGDEEAAAVGSECHLAPA